MKPCPCGGSNEACYFCGGKGAFAEPLQPVSSPPARHRNQVKKVDKPKRPGVVATKSSTSSNSPSRTKKAFEGPKIQCPGCRVLMTKQAFNAHLNACPRTYLYERCRWCSGRILRSKHGAHVKACPKLPAPARHAKPARPKSPPPAKEKGRSLQRCPVCGAAVSVRRMAKHLRTVHRVRSIEESPATVPPEPTAPNIVRTGRRFVIGRTMPLQEANLSRPRKPIASDEFRPKKKSGRRDVFDLPSRRLLYGGAFDSNRRRH